MAGKSELALVIGFCDRAVAAGLPLARARVLIDTLDPVHDGRVFRWGYDAGVRARLRPHYRDHRLRCGRAGLCSRCVGRRRLAQRPIFLGPPDDIQ